MDKYCSLRLKLAVVYTEFLFILLALATWRISHLLNKEDGPFHIIFLLRKKAGNSFWGSLLDCFYCVSVWIALPLGLLEGDNRWQKIYTGGHYLVQPACWNKQPAIKKIKLAVRTDD